MPRESWTRDQLLIVFNLYCRIPFGKMHNRNPDVRQVAARIGRTPAAVAMKLGNFASFDPAHQARDVHGLANASQADRAIWDEFHASWSTLAIESQKAAVRLSVADVLSQFNEIELRAGSTSVRRTVEVRLVQAFFRQTVLASYDHRCAICTLALPELLIASHIIPWRVSVERRADPRNGMALCALHDRAFDTGLIAIDESLRVLIRSEVKISDPPRLHKVALISIEGQKIHLPLRFHPDPVALRYHRTEIFGAHH